MAVWYHIHYTYSRLSRTMGFLRWHPNAPNASSTTSTTTTSTTTKRPMSKKPSLARARPNPTTTSTTTTTEEPDSEEMSDDYEEEYKVVCYFTNCTWYRSENTKGESSVAWSLKLRSRTKDFLRWYPNAPHQSPIHQSYGCWRWNVLDIWFRRFPELMRMWRIYPQERTFIALQVYPVIV